MPKVLVLSVASINAPHRKPYHVLARDWGWEVHLLVPEEYAISTGAKRLDPAEPGARYVLHPTHVHFVGSGRLAIFRGLLSLARRIRPDVIFAEYDPGTLTVIDAQLVARITGARVVAFTPENIARDRWNDAWLALKSLRASNVARDVSVAVLDRLGKMSTDGLACVNAEGARIFVEQRGWRRPVSIVPLGTDLDLFRPVDVTAAKATHGLAGGYVVGYFGRLIPEKGVHLLVEALARLPEDVRLLLDMFKNFEPGSYAASLFERARALGVERRIVTIDVPHGDVPTYMNMCDVVVLPSLSSPRWIEQYGRVLPEAMACRVPVIGSDSGNIPSLIGEAGLVFKEGSVDELVACIRRLRDDPTLAEMSRDKGALRVQRFWSVAVQARALAELFRSVASGIGERSPTLPRPTSVSGKR